MDPIPYRWQTDALEAWASNGCKGIAHVVTGAGKTRFALMAVKYLQNRSELPVNTIIVVPTCALMEQWIKELKNTFKGDTISRVGGGFRGEPEADFQVMVVNTARVVLPQRRNALLAKSHKVFLICDECHHYGSKENRKIFSGISPESSAYYTLGLSATPYSAWFGVVLEPALGKVFYTYEHDDALKDEIIAPFVVEQIAVKFKAEEAEEYSKLSFDIALMLKKLLSSRKSLKNLPSAEFFAELRKLREAGDDLAGGVIDLLTRRKELVLLADSRMQCVQSLAEVLPTDSKIILFCERISQTDAVYSALEGKYRCCLGKYHSGRPKEQNRSDMREFKSGDIRIMVACKGLDEGINVPEADIAIIVSGTSMTRQHIQRLGRILRRSRDREKTGVLYYLYVEGSCEESRYIPELSGNAQNVDLKFSQADGFSCREYEDTANAVLESLKKRGADDRQFKEARDCILEGFVLADWKRPLEFCINKAEEMAAKQDIHGENYWRCMGWMTRMNKKNFSERID